MEKRRASESKSARMRKAAGRKKSGEERQKERIRLFQLGLWVALILTQMMVVEGMKTYAFWQDTESGEETVTVCSELYPRKEDCPEPVESYQTESGEKYMRMSWETERVSVSGQSIPVIREGIYEQAEGITQLPESMNVEVERENQKTEVSCLLEDRAVIKEEWQDGFSFPVTYHKYGAEFYWLGEHLIEGGGDKPRLEGYENLLLEEIGVTPEFYRIVDIRWEGEPYEDETGELCRNAVASGQKLLRDYRLVYKGTASFPSYEAWRVTAVYGPAVSEDLLDDRQSEPPKEPVLTDLEESLPAAAAMQPSLTLWERITRLLLITIAVGAALFFGGLLILAVLWWRRAWMPYGMRQRDNKTKEQ